MARELKDSPGLRGDSLDHQHLSDHRHRDGRHENDGWGVYGLRRELQQNPNKGQLGSLVPQHCRHDITGQFELLHAITHLPDSKRGRQSSRQAHMVGHRYSKHSQSGFSEEEESRLVVDAGHFIRAASSSVCCLTQTRQHLYATAADEVLGTTRYFIPRSQPTITASSTHHRASSTWRRTTKPSFPIQRI